MDFSLKIIADKLNKKLENASEALKTELDGAVKNLANAAYAELVAKVQSTQMDPKNRSDYLKGLQFTDLGDNSYMITLEGDWINKLEGGFPSYDLKEKLLSSKKTVGVGSRAGESWVRTNKQGKKYTAVPFERKTTANNLSGDLASDIKNITAKNIAGIQQNITKIFKDESGKPIAGKVAVGSSSNSNLDKLVKYQHVYKSGKVQSLYLNFRMISENSSGWQHPGFSGYHFFDKIEEYVEKELENIVKIILD